LLKRQINYCLRFSSAGIREHATGGSAQTAEKLAAPGKSIATLRRAPRPRHSSETPPLSISGDEKTSPNAAA
jgi:hypothetical protein